MLPIVNLIQLSTIIPFLPHKTLNAFNKSGVSDVSLVWNWAFGSLKEKYFKFFKGTLSEQELKDLKNVFSIPEQKFNQAWEAMLSIDDALIRNFRQVVANNLDSQDELILVADLTPVQKKFFVEKFLKKLFESELGSNSAAYLMQSKEFSSSPSNTTPKTEFSSSSSSSYTTSKTVYTWGKYKLSVIYSCDAHAVGVDLLKAILEDRSLFSAYPQHNFRIIYPNYLDELAVEKTEKSQQSTMLERWFRWYIRHYMAKQHLDVGHKMLQLKSSHNCTTAPYNIDSREAMPLIILFAPDLYDANVVYNYDANVVYNRPPSITPMSERHSSSNKGEQERSDSSPHRRRRLLGCD